MEPEQDSQVDAVIVYVSVWLYVLYMLCCLGKSWVPVNEVTCNSIQPIRASYISTSATLLYVTPNKTISTKLMVSSVLS